jgi:hypothetical protein
MAAFGRMLGRDGWSVRNWSLPWYLWIPELLALALVALMLVGMVIAGIVVLCGKLLGWRAEKPEQPTSPPASTGESSQKGSA